MMAVPAWTWFGGSCLLLLLDPPLGLADLVLRVVRSGAGF